MTARYTRVILALTAAALLMMSVNSMFIGTARSNAQVKTQRRCVWTHINDQGEPNIGSNGKIDFSKSANWKAVSEGGWELKGVWNNSYVFEKCEP